MIDASKKTSSNAARFTAASRNIKERTSEIMRAKRTSKAPTRCTMSPWFSRRSHTAFPSAAMAPALYNRLSSDLTPLSQQRFFTYREETPAGSPPNVTVLTAVAATVRGSPVYRE